MKCFLCKLGLLTLLGISFFTAHFAYAAITYNRTPSGTEITSPVSFSVSIDNLSTDTDLEEACGGLPCSFWGVTVQNGASGSENNPVSSCISLSNLSGVFSVNLPLSFSATRVAIAGGETKERCEDYETNSGENVLEGDFESVIFTITAPVSTPSLGRSSTPHDFPQVDIFSPREGKYGKNIKIDYGITNYNEPDTLVDGAVSIYYTTTYSGSDKKLIAKDLPLVGTYEWNTAGLPENYYRIIISATDKQDYVGEKVSDAFFIDNSSPIFVVKTKPTITKGEDVKVIVEPSEQLAELPIVMVKQQYATEAEPITIKLISNTVNPDKDTYEGIYNVIKSFDGPALITVSGKDKNGNVGTTIVSGGKFFVGIDGPPKPVILSPTLKSITASGSVDVLGTVRPDTKVALLVNGKDKYETLPDENGSFAFKGVKLSYDFNNGLNFLSASAVDESGNSSIAETVSIKYNFTPDIKNIDLSQKNILNGQVDITVPVADKNNDELTFRYQFSSDNGKNWNDLEKSSSQNNYAWDTTQFNNGTYLIKVIVNDGTVSTEKIIGPVTIQNFAPIISFSDPEGDVAINKNEITIKGTVKSPDKITGKDGLPVARPKPVSLDYSLDAGKKWISIDAADGVFNSFEEGFSLRLTGLEEKAYTVLFRVEDSRKIYGFAVKKIVVDFKAPQTPKIQSPTSSQVIGGESADKNGFDFDVIGTSEPESTVGVVLNGNLFKDRTGGDGNFKVRVTFTKTGKNKFVIYALDAAGNKSQEAELNVIYNNPPVVRFLNPRPGRGLNHTAEIKWEIKDVDGDVIKNLILSYRKGNESFQTIFQSPDGSKNSFKWDVSGLPDGNNYQLKIEASDGVNTSQKINNFSIDNTPPVINVESLANITVTKSFVLNVQGAASDDFSGVEFVEFSVDGEHWYKALITKGFLEKEANFTINQKLNLFDDTYTIQFRAVDSAGNTSVPETQTVTIDTKAPRVGSYTLSKGAIILFPEGDSFKILKDSKIKLTLSLEQDTANATLSIGGWQGKLEKNKSTGLWEVEIPFSESGSFPILISAKDNNGNSTKDKEIGLVTTINPGQISSDQGVAIEGAKISAEVFDDQSQSFVNWQGENYGLTNSVLSDATGKYSLLLPTGKYRIVIQKTGFERVSSTEFTIIGAKFINFDFSLIKRQGIRGFLEDVLEKLNLNL